MHRIEMKIAILRADKRHWQLASAASKRLPEDQQLSEQHVTQIVTRRKKPTLLQAEAIAEVLGRKVREIFPGEFEMSE